MAQSPQWDPSFSVGHPLLDEQHKHLLTLCAEASELIEGDMVANRERFHNLINDVFVTSTVHMRLEEEILRKCHYPTIDAHANEHTQFIDRLTTLLCEATNGDLNTFELNDLLTNWWGNHVLHSDMAFKEYIHNQ